MEQKEKMENFNNNKEFSWQNLEITPTAPKREVWIDKTPNPENVVRLGPWTKNAERKDQPKFKITSPKKGTLRLASKYEIEYLRGDDLTLKKTILNDEIEEKTDKLDSLKTRLAKRRAARKKEKEDEKNEKEEFVVVDKLEDKEKAKRPCSKENLPDAKKKKVNSEHKAEINEDKSVPEVIYSAKDLCKFEFNLQFSLRRIPADRFSHDFSALTATSSIRGSRQFREYLQDRKAQVKAKGRDIIENGNAALVLAESIFLKICERVIQSKDESVLVSEDFLAMVNSLKSSSAAEKFYNERKKVFIDTVRPELKEKLKKNLI